MKPTHGTPAEAAAWMDQVRDHYSAVNEDERRRRHEALLDRYDEQTEAAIRADDNFAWEYDRLMEMPTAAEVDSWDS